jgi:hypothetical protein
MEIRPAIVSHRGHGSQIDFAVYRQPSEASTEFHEIFFEVSFSVSDSTFA